MRHHNLKSILTRFDPKFFQSGWTDPTSHKIFLVVILPDLTCPEFRLRGIKNTHEPGQKIAKQAYYMKQGHSIFGGCVYSLFRACDCLGLVHQVSRFILTESVRVVMIVSYVCDLYWHHRRTVSNPRSTMQERMTVTSALPERLSIWGRDPCETLSILSPFSIT